MKTINAHGAHIPQLGFGTFRMPEADVLAILPKALQSGFTHVDTAQIYENEAAVGMAIRNSGIARENIFLTTKVWVANYGKDAFAASVEESLRKLKTDHVDLMQLHNIRMDLVDDDAVWETMEDLKAEGKIRHYGVALGPAIGWLAEGVRAIKVRRPAVLQHIYNILEQHPGKTIHAAAEDCDLRTAEGRSRLAARARPLWQLLPAGALAAQLLGDIAAQVQIGTRPMP